jgi:uncharacterized repeat protein (TIGR03803 family)
MKRILVYASIVLFFAFCAVIGLPGQVASTVPTYKVLYTFQALGGTPTNIVEVKPGKFFGVVATSPGVFSIGSNGGYRYVYSFPTLSSGLVVFGLTPSLNGQSYGSAETPGVAPTVSELFSITLGGRVTTYPYNPATQGGIFNREVQSPDGYMYAIFGVENGSFSFNRLDYAGTPTSLYTFPPNQGQPGEVLFLGKDGAFYGLTLMNNRTEAGIFRLTKSGSFSWVVPSFATGGVNYGIALIQAGNGNFYGTLPEGGSAGAGSIYQVTPAGQMTTLYEFSDVNLGIPETLIQADDGMLWGTARGRFNTGFNGYSSIFRLNPNTSVFQTIYKMKNGGVTGACECWMIQGSDGNFYGTTENEGTYQLGTIFQLDAGLPPPKPHIVSFGPTAGSVGQKVLLWGSNLLGATAVDFNGTPASAFVVASGQGIWADVPSGATSGPITVTTPNGTFTTKQNFTLQ